MKVLFLDIDGVLNSEVFYTKKSQWERYKRAEDSGYTRDERRALANIDKRAVSLLNYIVENTDAEIVISSTWRSDFNLPYIMRFVGLKRPYYGITPYDKSRHRGTEIQTWLDDYGNNVKYVILDDDSDMLERQLPYFIKVDPYYGLTKEIADKVIEILNN